MKKLWMNFYFRSWVMVAKNIFAVTVMYYIYTNGVYPWIREAAVICMASTLFLSFTAIDFMDYRKEIEKKIDHNNFINGVDWSGPCELLAQKVSTDFGWDQKKSMEWIFISNGNFGGSRPIDLMLSGRTSKVIAYVDAVSRGF